MAKKQRKKPTTTWGKIWYFIWYDNSLLSWIVNVILAFVLIKFIIYPGIGLILGTSLPVVAVVSESMDHGYVKMPLINPQTGQCQEVYRLCGDIQETRTSSNFDTFWEICGPWYEDHDIEKNHFSSFTFSNGFSKGDIIVLIGKDPKDIEVGDITVFNANYKAYPIIHRVVSIEDDYFETKGDHNPAQISDAALNEKHVDHDKFLGVAVAKIPWLGWVKIGLVELFNPSASC